VWIVSIAVAFFGFATMHIRKYTLNRKKCQTFFAKKVKLIFPHYQDRRKAQ